MKCLCTSYVSITGYLMLANLFIGYAISTQKAIYLLEGIFPALTKYTQNFSFFYWSHVGMACSFVGILPFHPLPGLPKLNYFTGSIAWIFLATPLILYVWQTVTICVPVVSASTYVSECRALPGKVVMMQCPTPGSVVSCKAGQYVKICIPVVQYNEWHPFFPLALKNTRY